MRSSRRPRASRVAALVPLAILLATAVALLAAGAASAAPSVSAPSAILVEPRTGETLFERRAERARPIASVTKLMTALLVLEDGGLGTREPASSYRAAPIESKLSLRPGERLTRADLLRGLLLESANDAAVTLAEAVSGSRRAFVRAMNRRARELGLRRTRFVDPIGISPGNRSSPRDLVRLTLELRRSPFFKRTVNRQAVTLAGGDRPRTIDNRNTLLGSDRFVSGVKTGRTQRAGFNLVGTYGRGGVTVVSVVLGTQSDSARNADTLALLRFGASRFSRRRVARAGAFATRIPIRFRRGAELDLVAARTVRRVLRRGGPRPRLRVIEAPAEAVGPIARGQRLGRAEVLVGPERVATVSLVAGASVPEAGVAQRTKAWLSRPLGFLGALLVLLSAGTLLLRRRAARNGTPPTRPPTPRSERAGPAEAEAA